MKFALFSQQSSDSASTLWSFPTEQITDVDDSYSVILGLARHICQRISLNFTPSVLSQTDVTTCQSLENDPTLVWDWKRLWKNLTYNEWLEYLSECAFYTIRNTSEPTDKHDVYFVPVHNEESFVSQLNKLSIQVKLATQSEMIESASVLTDTKSIFYQGKQLIQLSNIILQKQNLLNSESSRDHTVIFIVNKSTTTREAFIEQLKLNLPRMPTKALYMGILRQDHEKWLQYDAAISNKLPTDEVLKNAKAIVLPGSSNSAYDTQPWILEYKDWLRRAYNEFKHLKFLGVCFGEQILAEALGGKSSKTQKRELDPMYYDVTVQKLSLSQSFMDLPFVKRLSLPKNEYWISKAHGDIVSQVDTNKLQVVGHSKKYDVEVIIDKNTSDCRLLAIQGHPEYSGEWAVRKNTDFHIFFFKKDFEEEFKRARAEYESDSPSDHFVFRDICMSFLNS